jgi:hypothetical protein
MQITPGQAASTRRAYPLTTTEAPASPWLSLLTISPAGGLHSADVIRVDAHGRFKLFPPPGRREAGVANGPRGPFSYPRPFPSGQRG